jgi:Succinate dehydrogenase/fumarate reductase, flavoprotein subunit
LTLSLAQGKTFFGRADFLPGRKPRRAMQTDPARHFRSRSARSKPDILRTDVLVLGCGLSGLRAAWAAKETAPDMRVMVTGLSPGPSGSSFTNRNNALGVQLLDTPARRRAFETEATALGNPGYVTPPLVNILARESAARLREMEALGLAFRRTPTGELRRYPGCGSAEPTAVIFDNIQDAFNQYINKTTEYGVEFLTGPEVLGVFSQDGAACGAWGADTHTGRLTAVKSRAVIMALGGPAPLFARHQAGRVNPGTSLGILADAGVATANEPYLQFMWGRPDGAFLNPAELLAPGNSLRLADGSRLDAMDAAGSGLAALRGLRRTHCPAFFHRDQALLDRILLDSTHDDGFARVETPDGIITAGLFAHAGNGGAVIDEHGETSLPGLFALGECATGMHGANRVGGAMVLATQVFGRRAGIRAVERAKTGVSITDRQFIRLVEEKTEGWDHSPDAAQAAQTIRDGLTRHACFAAGVWTGNAQGVTSLEEFRSHVRGLTTSADRRTRLTALAALLVSGPPSDGHQHSAE